MIPTTWSLPMSLLHSLLSSAPVQGVSITRLSASSVQVSWEPFTTEANVTGYTVIYSRVSGSSKRQDGEMRSIFPATTTSGVIDGLESEATYVFQVLVSAGLCCGGRGGGDRRQINADKRQSSNCNRYTLLYNYINS